MVQPGKSNRRIAVVLPPAENFTPSAADAVSIFVRDTCFYSPYRSGITVYGQDTPRTRLFREVRFQGLSPRWSLFRSAQSRYIQSFLRELTSPLPQLLEVHNDVETFAKIARRFPNIPNIFYLHQDPALIPLLSTPKLRWAFINKASAIVCSSDYVRRRFITGLEAARTDHVHVVYHGAEVQQAGPKERLILYVGRVVPEKGLLELAHAMQLLLPHHPQWRLLVVGSSPTKPTPQQKSYLQAIHVNLKKLGRQAIWLDTQPHDKLQQLYARSSVAVVPSIAPEPVGRTAIEALAAGAALVSSGHGSLYEILGNSGVVVDPVTPQGLALAIQGLIEDPNTLYGVQRDCMERSTHFAAMRCQNQIDQLRRSLMNHR
ncbi:MAG TPA: glycosyltransferase family 4 protein [Alphaproteobacteria bacterium]